MRQLVEFIRKEFYHIIRDPRSMLVLLGMPIVQIILFGFAITTEIRNSSIAILDNARDDATQNIISRMENSQYFSIQKDLINNDQVYTAFKTGKIKMAVVFEPGFAENLKHNNKAKVQILTDGSDPNNAVTLTNYASSIILDYQASYNQMQALPMAIETEMRMLYNPRLKGIYSSVPGVMGLILLLISAMMTSIAIVKEKEMGTMEVLLVSPVKPWLVVISKTVPYFALSLINVATILLLSVYVMGMPVMGNVILLFGVSTLYIFCSLALGIFISTNTSTQQAAMLASIMGLMLPVMLLSGYMFPVANMPVVLQVISNIIPAKWYIIMVKSIMIKGLGIGSIWKEILILNGMTLFFLLISIKRYKIRLS
ncbi:MAG: ABC transporter permease [Ignavibacteria bacterium]|nr:ABC transporter permease [Ignavibacteria bacterium]